MIKRRRKKIVIINFIKRIRTKVIMQLELLILLLISVSLRRVDCEVARNSTTSLHEHEFINIVKCCEPFELLLDDSCTNVKDTNETKPWKPLFADEASIDGRTLSKQQPNYQLKIGSPRFVLKKKTKNKTILVFFQFKN